MVVADGLMAGFGGFAAGAACVWWQAGRLRGELHRMRFAAEHDCLTGLPNRAGIRRHYDLACSQDSRPTVALLDLDGFKQVNDAFGHHVGDRLLKSVAAQLDAACRGVAPVGRLGGDEFLILLPRLSSSETAARLNGILQRLAVPITVRDDIVLAAQASIGVAMATADAAWSSQLRHADIALYHAKIGRAGVVEFRDGMEHPPSPSTAHRRRDSQRASAAAGS